MPYKLEDAAIFRKGVSTIVETTLEAITKSPFTNYINNISTLMATLKNKEAFYYEAIHVYGNVELRHQIEQEMFLWYTEQSKIKYDPFIVSVVSEAITEHVAINIGGFARMFQAINEYKASKEPQKEKK